MPSRYCIDANFSVESLWTNLMNFQQDTFFLWRKANEYVVSQMAAILLRPKCQTINACHKQLIQTHRQYWLLKYCSLPNYYYRVWLIEAEWRIYALVNYAIIGSDNGLSPVWHQTIVWTSAGILLIWCLGTNLWWLEWLMGQSGRRMEMNVIGQSHAGSSKFAF